MVQKFFRNVLRLKAELIAEKFEPETLQVMTGKEVSPEINALLKDNASRDFRVDIETDSTIATDQEAEKAKLNEALQSVAGFVTAVGPLVQTGAVPGPVMVQLLLTYVRKFDWGSELEDAIESAKDFQPAPDAQSQKLSAEQQAKQQEFQLKQAQTQADLEAKKLESQIKIREMQELGQVKRQEAASKERLAELEFQAEQRRKDRETQAEIDRKNKEVEAEIQRDAAKAQLEMQVQVMKTAAETGVSPDGKKNLPTGEASFRYDDDGNIIGATLNG
jgi:hypothetical protein